MEFDKFIGGLSEESRHVFMRIAKEIQSDDISRMLSSMSISNEPYAYTRLCHKERIKLYDMFKFCESVNAAINYVGGDCEKRRELYSTNQEFKGMRKSISQQNVSGSSTYMTFYNELEKILTDLLDEFSNSIYCCYRDISLAISYSDDDYTSQSGYDLFLCESCATNPEVLRFWLTYLHQEHKDLIGGRFYFALNDNEECNVIAFPNVINTPEKIVDIVRQKHMFNDVCLEPVVIW